MESRGGGVSDIMTKIDINANPGGVITLNPAQISHESFLQSQSINFLEVRITDERNRLLDLNGLHIQLGFKFRFVDKIAQMVPTRRPSIGTTKTPSRQNKKKKPKTK
jgi:hypothetical protein